MPRPWNAIPIHDAGEPLVELPPALHRLEPHPYQRLGAPYGGTATPFRLRRGVVERLLEAQRQLRTAEPGWQLAIFDAWRPLAVQQFMVEHAIAEECRRRGVDGRRMSAAREAVIETVRRFWAPPSPDPATPPPHSTGAAVDLTLAVDGVPLPMGGEIDSIDPVSEPGHYAAAAAADPGGAAAEWNRRRELLARVMDQAGFVRHPNEWWHFSHGDQLWAWQRGLPAALYGRVPEGGAEGALEGAGEGRA
jgi:D-alanyl-D-alanine dipeptidase